MDWSFGWIWSCLHDVDNVDCSYSVAVIVCVTVTEATARLQAAATMWIMWTETTASQ